jgi:glycosyltransferase involved in cell wall biosynthesis
LETLLIDITRLVDRRLKERLPTGVDRVSLEYVRHFFSRSSALVRFGGRWNEFGRADSERVFEALLSAQGNFRKLILPLVAKAYLHNLIRQRQSPYFLLNTGHSGVQCYQGRMLHNLARPLFFLHDLIPLRYPEFCRPGEFLRHKQRMNALLRCGRGVIANSAVTLSDFELYAREVGLPVPPTVVAGLAPATLPTPAKQSPLEDPYFVVLGTIEPRKNHWLLLQIWRRLIERMGASAPRLVIIGQRGWECENVLDLLERCQAFRGVVLEHSTCTDGELSTYLHHARALLFPSFAEGYGMPLVEALALDVPVIASNLPAFREGAGDIPEYIDPLDGTRWEEAILEYAGKSAPRRTAQLLRMREFRVPRWSEHFAVVDRFMEQLAEAP